MEDLVAGVFRQEKQEYGEGQDRIQLGCYPYSQTEAAPEVLSS